MSIHLCVWIADAISFNILGDYTEYMWEGVTSLDRRTMTRHLLQEGLLHSLQSQSFEQITITSLTKAAGITRSTFYLHYTNIMEVVDDILDTALVSVANGTIDMHNLAIIANTLEHADSPESLRTAYEEIYSRLPLCQRVATNDKYKVLFQDEQLSEYLVQRIICFEKDVQVPILSQALGVSTEVGESIFVFLVKGLYAVNHQYNWERSDAWLNAQKAIFSMVYRGLSR